MTKGKTPSDDEGLMRASESVRLAASDRATSPDPRTHAAWRTWLAALAKDAAAATAAALAYESLGAEGRDAWLDALDADAPDVDVPKIALYAPLLGVEQDDARRERIAAQVTGAAKRSTPPRALVGSKNGDRVCLIVSPLYLDFVELLFCRYDQDQGIREARHEWLVHKNEVLTCARDLGVTMIDVPLPQVVEEIAHAVVADRRAGRDAPDALMVYIDLFAPDLPPSSDVSNE
ncbi:MAG: hypothetical protein JWO86_1125 [Myxococcaceae bacterium]|nr:hypothetical protein [Myxococcaceae bacterium]